MNTQAHLKEMAAVLEADQESLDQLFEKARWLPPTKLFVAVRAHVEQHITREERALDGLLADGLCTGKVAAGITAAHALMTGLIVSARDAIGHADTVAFAQAFDSLVRVTAAHGRREEEEVMPMLCARFRQTLRDGEVDW